MELITAFPKPTIDIKKVTTTVPDVTTIIPEPTKQNFKSYMKGVFNSPKKSTIFLLALALVVSLLLFGFLIIGQNLSATKQLKIQGENYSKAIKTKDENSKKQIAALKQTQDKTRKDNLNQIRSSLERYYTSNDYYPTILSDLAPYFISIIPTDPETSQQYYYLSSLDQKTYILRATLSNGKEIELSNN